MLFLHGQFLPPRVYTDKLLVPLFDRLEAKDWEVVCLASPRHCEDPPLPVISEMFPDVRSEEMAEWINSHQRDENSKEYMGLNDSLSFLQEYLRKEPRFDIVAGHSNGALMASVLSLYQQSAMLPSLDGWTVPTEKRFRGILCMNAPNSYDNEIQLSPIVNEQGSVTLPSIHVFGGSTDFALAGSKRMRDVDHPNGKILEHEAGHFFPSNDDETGKEFYESLCRELESIVAAPST